MRNFSFHPIIFSVSIIITVFSLHADNKEQSHSEDFNKAIAAIHATARDRNPENISRVLGALKIFSEKTRTELLEKNSEYIKSANELEKASADFEIYRKRIIESDPELKQLLAKQDRLKINIRRDPGNMEQQEELEEITEKIDEYFKGDKEYIKHELKKKFFSDLKWEILRSSPDLLAKEYLTIVDEFKKLKNSKTETDTACIADIFNEIIPKFMESDICKMRTDFIEKKLKEENPGIENEKINTIITAICEKGNQDKAVEILTGLTNKIRGKDFTRIFLLVAEEIKTEKVIHNNLLQSMEKVISEGRVSGNDALLILRWFYSIYDEDMHCDFSKNLSKSTKADPWLKNVILGEAEIHLAWKSRGSGWAKTVTKDGWKGFYEHLAKARKFLVQAHEMRPEFPDAASGMIRVATGSCGELSERIEWFKKAIEAQGDFRPAYSCIEWALRPRWGGSPELLRDLGEACINSRFPDTSIPEYGLNSLTAAAEECDDYRWQLSYREPAVIKLINLLEEKKSRKLNQEDKDKITVTQISLLIAMRNYEKAAAAISDMGKEKFNSLLRKIVDTEEECNRMKTVNAWVNCETVLKVFTGPRKEKFFALESDYLNEKDNFKKDLLALIKSGALPEDEKEFAIDFYGRTKLEACSLDSLGNHKTALNAAIAGIEEDRNLRLTKELIILGASLKAADTEGRSPLCLAAIYKNPEVFKLLLDAGAELNSKDKYGRTAFVYALRNNAPFDIIEEAIKKGADLNTKDKYGWTPLMHFAWFSSDRKIILLLLQNGADVNAADKNNSTPLGLVASRKKGAENIKLLLEAGANVNASGKTGQKLTPLLEALSNKIITPENIKLLIEAGADFNAVNSEGLSPLFLAAKRKSPEIFKLLLDAGANVNLREPKKNYTAFVWAIRYDMPRECIEAAIKKGADVNARDKRNWTALMQAIWCSTDPEVVSLLLQNGAKVNEGDKDNSTPLMVAACLENGAENVRFLLKAGADVNAQEIRGQGLTPLIAAISRHGTLETVKLLVEGGADIGKKDLKNLSPLDWAVKLKKNNMADYLRSKL